MGAYVSRQECAAHYKINVDCAGPVMDANGTVESIGGITRGNFQADPDISGIGVLGAFLAVTSFSLILAVASGLWWLSKYALRWKRRKDAEEKAKKPWTLSLTSLFETLLITLSDQQVFTGGAYAITLRYSKGCSISAYHYNIVANMLLLTCATHLMAITLAKHYWEHKVVAFLRIIITGGVYLATGLLLANQASTGLGFPTEVPPANTTDSLMFLPAACFQGDGGSLVATLGESLSSANNLKMALLGSEVGAKIHGWNQYLVMLIFFLIALAVGTGRSVHHSKQEKSGRRPSQAEGEGRTPKTIVLNYVFGFYLLLGVAISAWTTITSALYIVQLRTWVAKSGWMETDNGENPEDDPTTFGQLVPLLLIAGTVFTFLQIVSEQLIWRKSQRIKNGEPQGAPNVTGNHNNDSNDDGIVKTNTWESNTSYNTASENQYTGNHVPVAENHFANNQFDDQRRHSYASTKFSVGITQTPARHPTTRTQRPISAVSDASSRYSVSLHNHPLRTDTDMTTASNYAARHSRYPVRSYTNGSKATEYSLPVMIEDDDMVMSPLSIDGDRNLPPMPRIEEMDQYKETTRRERVRMSIMERGRFQDPREM